MVNDPELLMQLARDKQEELRRAMKSAQRPPFRRTLSLLRRPARSVGQPLRSVRREA
jgi:hypothetical protein